jgi:AcrR family transcriptional regulator
MAITEVEMAVAKTARATKKRGSLGRPEGRTESREALLDAAERYFAERGYAAANLREIAEDANVTQAMANYWFGTKQELFRQVYLRRGAWLATRRMELLDEVTAKKRYALEDILRAYITPPFQLRESAQGRAFLRLQARLHAEPDETAYALRREVYDQPVRAYVKILANLLPRLTDEHLYLRFAQFIGIYIYILSDAHRIEEISGIRRRPPPAAKLIEEIVRFTASGFRG